jgi:hypothetical protein
MSYILLVEDLFDFILVFISYKLVIAMSRLTTNKVVGLLRLAREAYYRIRHGFLEVY